MSSFIRVYTSTQSSNRTQRKGSSNVLMIEKAEATDAISIPRLTNEEHDFFSNKKTKGESFLDLKKWQKPSTTNGYLLKLSPASPATANVPLEELDAENSVKFTGGIIWLKGKVSNRKTNWTVPGWPTGWITSFILNRLISWETNPKEKIRLSDWVI